MVLCSNYFSMIEKIYQRICVTFCQKVGETCKDTFVKLQKMYGDVCMNLRLVYEWFKRCKDECESVESAK